MYTTITEIAILKIVVAGFRGGRGGGGGRGGFGGNRWQDQGPPEEVMGKE